MRSGTLVSSRVLLLACGLLMPASPGHAAGGDAARTVLLSDRVLTALERMAAWGAVALGEPGPGPDFAATTRRYLAEHPTQPSTMAMLVRAEELYPYMARALARMSSAERTRWVQRLRPVVDGSDNKPLALAAAMSGFASHEYDVEHHRVQAAPNGLASRMAQQTIMFNQLAMQNTWQRYNMGQMARSFGNPH